MEDNSLVKSTFRIERRFLVHSSLEYVDVINKNDLMESNVILKHAIATSVPIIINVQYLPDMLRLDSESDEEKLFEFRSILTEKNLVTESGFETIETSKSRSNLNESKDPFYIRHQRFITSWNEQKDKVRLRNLFGIGNYFFPQKCDSIFSPTFAAFLFVGTDKSTTGLHFDSTDNILFMGEGRKLVVLIHPLLKESLNLSDQEKMLLSKPYGKSPLVDIDLVADLDSMSLLEDSSDLHWDSNIANWKLFKDLNLHERTGLLRFEILSMGDILLIPKRWIHMAVNLPIHDQSQSGLTISATVQCSC